MSRKLQILLLLLLGLSTVLGNTTCRANINNCAQCLDSNTCQFCDFPDELLNNQCQTCGGVVQCDPNVGCYGSPPDNQFCCMANCGSCLDGTSCSACVAKFYYDQTAKSCTACDTTCTSGYCYGTGNQCCKSNCVQCLSATVCLKCVDGYIRVGDNCIQQCKNGTNNCVECESLQACKTCAAKTTLYNLEIDVAVCLNCPAGCDKCTFDGTNYTCQLCSSKYYWDAVNNKCTQCTTCGGLYCFATSGCCESNCVQCNSATNCVTCAANFDNFQQNCVPLCASNVNYCITCKDQHTCLQCVSGYYVATDNTTLVQACTACSTDICPNGYCFGPSNTQCCSTGCKLCQSTTTCTACDTAYNAFQNGCRIKCSNGKDNCLTCSSQQVCTKCGAGFYADTDNLVTACVQCPTGCATCTSGNLCQICQDTYYFDGSVCQKCNSCDNQRCFGPDAASCCDITCQTCNAGTKNDCTTCNQGQNLYNGQCINQCLANTDNCQSCLNLQQCTQCDYGFFLDTSKSGIVKTCVACPTGCASCTSATICSACLPTFYLDTVNKVCQQCSADCTNSYCFGPGTTDCCSAECDVCTSDTACLHCLEPFYLFSQACINQCQATRNHCTTCEDQDTCTACDTGYYVKTSGTTKACSVCPLQCTACTLSNFCTDCKSGYYLSDLNQCTTCTGQASNCPNGYCFGKDAGQCCLANCSQCKDGTTCATCADQFFLFDNSCKPNCANGINNCTTCNGLNNCQTCNVGYYINQNQAKDSSICQACPTGCTTCTSATQCTGCIAGYYFTAANNTCTKCANTGGNCAYCFGPNTNQCCSLNCNSCTDANTCQSCFLGYNLFQSKCVKACSKNIDNCQLCADTKNCSTCSDGYYPLADTNTGVTICQQCPTGCLLCGTNGKCKTCGSTYYLDANSVCQQCSTSSSSCQYNACYGPSKGFCCKPFCNICTKADDCQSCVNLYNLYGTDCVPNCSNGSNNCKNCQDIDTCQQCNDGFYLNTLNNVTICVPCGNNCVKCSQDGKTCSLCNSGFYLNQGACTTCPSGVCDNNFCYGPTKLECCPQNCKQCSSTACLTCVDSTFFYDTQCVDTCSDGKNNCAKCTDSKTCQSCKDNFYPSTKTGVTICVQCPANCATCTDSQTCSSCVNTYYFDAATKGCIKCPTDAGFCPGAYCFGPGKTDCCEENCVNCKSANICTACEQPFNLQNNVCYNQCTVDDKCKECKDTKNCATCQDGFYKKTAYSQDSCIACDLSCANCCSGNSCLTCAKGYYQVSTSALCVKQIICNDLENCKTCETDAVNNSAYCKECNDSYFLTEAKTCLKCDASCKSCSTDSSVCTECLNTTDFKLVGSMCMPICKADCTLNQCCEDGQCNNNKCSQCKPHYYADKDSVCQPCPADTPQCFYDTVSTGPMTCITNCLACSNKDSCITCQQGYYSDNTQKCQSCSNQVGCISCLVSDKCLACDFEKGYVLDSTFTKCVLCNVNDVNCTTCNSQNCLSCKDGFYLDSTFKCVLCEDTNCGVCIGRNCCGLCKYDYKLNNILGTCVYEPVPSSDSSSSTIFSMILQFAYAYAFCFFILFFLF